MRSWARRSPGAPGRRCFTTGPAASIWLALAASDDAGAARIGPAVAAAGGHATLIRAPAAVRAAIDVFAPQEAGLAALTKRVKEGFDPKGVLNPGRMWAGV